MRYGLGQQSTCAAGSTWVTLPQQGGIIAGQCIPNSFATQIKNNWAQTSATLSNVSRPGQSPQIGDQWSLAITGTPNTPVTGSASQNGAGASTSPMGTTDASGNLTLTGTFGAADVGSWVESYLVGSGSPATVSFTVAAPAPYYPTAPAGTSNSTGSSSNSSSSSTPAPLDLSFLTNNVSILGFSVPVWALIAAAGGGLLLMGNKR